MVWGRAWYMCGGWKTTSDVDSLLLSHLQAAVGHLTIVTVSKCDSYNYLPLANWPSCFLVFIGKASLFKYWILVFKNECAAEDHVGFCGPITAGICVSVCVATVGHVDARDLCCSLKPCWCPWAVLQLGAVLM